MNQEIFYKELEKLDKVEILKKEYLLNNEEVLRDKIKILFEKINNQVASEEEIKLYVSITYLTGHRELKNNDVSVCKIPEDIEFYEEFTMALVFKGFRDGLGNPDSNLNYYLYINIRTNPRLEKFIKLVRKEDLPLIKENVLKFIGNYSNYNEAFKAICFPDYKLDLEKTNVLYNNTDLEMISRIKNINYDRINLFRSIIAVPYEISNYNLSFLAGVNMLFKLSKVTTPLTEDEYELLAVYLNHHGLKEYSLLAIKSIDSDFEDEFRLLCRAYIKLINTKSKSVIVNRVDKILFTELKDRKCLGLIMREELLKYEGSKTLTKAIVEKSL